MLRNPRRIAIPSSCSGEARPASLGPEFNSYLAKAYLRAIAKASIVSAHPCERPDVMPLVLAYLTAALDEHPTDGSFRELLRAYQYLNHTSEALNRRCV
jgi:hypothetical protein